MDPWEEYSAEGGWEHIKLEDLEDDTEALAAMGHNLTTKPCAAFMGELKRLMDTYFRNVDIENPGFLPVLPDTEGDLPLRCDFLIVGAGMSGISQARSCWQRGITDVVVVDRDRRIGGIWYYYANDFSRVNTSEVGYRIWDKATINERPNEDHTPRHDILRDIYLVAQECVSKGAMFRTQWD